MSGVHEIIHKQSDYWFSLHKAQRLRGSSASMIDCTAGMSERASSGSGNATCTTVSWLSSDKRGFGGAGAGGSAFSADSQILQHFGNASCRKNLRMQGVSKMYTLFGR